MSFHQIPLPQDVSHFVQQAILDNVTYTLRCHYNERENSWYMDLLDVEQNPIVCGRKLVADWPLLHRSRHTSLPPGQLYMVDLSDAGIDPSLADIGSRVILVYADEVEMAA